MKLEFKAVKPVPVFDNECKQFIADMYHCSETWGHKTSEKNMYMCLVELNKEKDPEEFSPDPYLFKECAKYWNELCDMYPN